MSRWWRAYDEAVNDPKIQLMPGPLFKAWFNLLCVASGNGGALPHVESLAFTLKTTEAKIGSVLEDLIARGLVDDVEGVLRPHNWSGRQFKSDTDQSNAERQRRYRARNANSNVTNANSNVTNNAPRVQKTDTERKEEDTADAVSSATYVFESGVIRLSQKSFDQWKLAFSHLDLAAELIALTEWASAQPKWFFAVSGALAKKNRELGLRVEQNKTDGLTNDERYWGKGRIPGIQ